jgi:hypothetical protein
VTVTHCARTICKRTTTTPKQDGWVWIEFELGPTEDRLVVSRVRRRGAPDLGPARRQSRHGAVALKLPARREEEGIQHAARAAA